MYKKINNAMLIAACAALLSCPYPNAATAQDVPASANTVAATATAPQAAMPELQHILSQPELTIDGVEMDVADLNAFYALRQYRLAWDTRPSGNGAALQGFLAFVAAFADYHGLERGDYHLDRMQQLIASANPDDANKLDLFVTQLLLRLAHTMHGDDIDLALLYPGWKFKRDAADIPAGLEHAMEANQLNEFIAGLAPVNPAYVHLAQALRTYRDMAQKGPWPTVEDGPVLKPGMHDKRVAEIRNRLTAEGYADAAATDSKSAQTYDDGLAHVVETWQLRNGLKGDGHIGSASIATLNITIEDRIDQIVANMVRWRHMPDSFPPRYTAVNIPDASVDVFSDGKPIYHGIVIVGRVDRKTPFIGSAINSVIFNPAWHVPISIARKDILPKLRKDPHYLEKLGISINGNESDPHGKNIDWRAMSDSEFHYKLKQSPGDLNSLGRIKFDFPNDFSVYMHGTPHHELFAKNERTLSSGCVRLHDPDIFAQLVLAHNDGDWTQDKIHAAVDAMQTHWVKVTDPMPIYFLYWTVFDDQSGNVNFRDDSYDYDSFLLENMRKNHTRESDDNP